MAIVVLLLVAQLFRSQTSSASTPAAQPAVLRAQAFELVDKAGKVVAQLHVGEDGGGNIRLRSGDGMVRVKLGATATGSGLILFDREAEPAVHLVANQTGTSATLGEKGKDKKVLVP